MAAVLTLGKRWIASINKMARKIARLTRVTQTKRKYKSQHLQLKFWRPLGSSICTMTNDNYVDYDINIPTKQPNSWRNIYIMRHIINVIRYNYFTAAKHFSQLKLTIRLQSKLLSRLVVTLLLLLMPALSSCQYSSSSDTSHILSLRSDIQSSLSSLATLSYSDPSASVNTVQHVTVFPRRRSSSGSIDGAMQSRAVDTSAQFEVHEGQPRGTFVGFIPTKPNFIYRFNEPPREFTLDQVTGEIKTNMILDREGMRERYDLVVLSSQPTYPIEVRILVLDINDNAPVFPEPSIAVSFSESAVPGTRLLLDAATDADIGINSVTDDYRFVDGNKEEKFRLAVTMNPSGDVSYLHLETTGNLDRESCGFYQLNISARDGGSPSKYGYLQVNVTILDVNDNPPIFDHSDYIISLNESVASGTEILRVMASDIDLGDNSKITYYLAESQTQFAVNPETGVISTTEHLNCPQQNCPTYTGQDNSCPKSCVFTVFARDHGSPRQDGRTYVTVNLLGTNDHDPVIRFQYFSPTGTFATVDENAVNDSVVAAISVLDLDDGLNGQTNISIVAGNELQHFRLDSFNIVRVSGVLDREHINKYNLTVVAVDQGTPPRSTTSYLIINVNDVNDHDPVFEKSEYSAVLSELAPIGSFVTSITATDEDTGVNALINYDFVSGNTENWFSINSVSGLITTNAALDREVYDSIELSISARDGGPNPKWAYTTLKVTILDENDEAPQFLQQHINVSLSENVVPQTLIAILTAADHDQGTNGSVTYSLSDFVERKYPQQFALDALSGQLTTRRTLDRETTAHYEIFVIARDQGTPPQSSTATVYMNVDDINDNSPIFYPMRYFYALSDYEADSAATGPSDHGGTNVRMQDHQPLLTVTATDRDVGDNALITYKLESGGNGMFEVDAWSGAITLRGDVRKANSVFHKLRISAKDHGDRRSKQDAIVEIVMQSMLETLEFDSYATYEFDIIEDHGGLQSNNSILGREIGRVKLKSFIVDAIASDHQNSVAIKATGNTNGRPTNISTNIEYAIVYGDEEDDFAIDARNGHITTAHIIDRERRATYQLTVVARSGYAYGKCQVHINIGDLNDNAPFFEPDLESEVWLAEYTAVGQEVYISRARDYDAAQNSRLTYTLSYNPNDQFRVGAQNGVLYLNRPLRNSPGTVLHVELTATDGGVPPLSTKQTVAVLIRDVNDHTPVFDHTSYETSLLESTLVNTRFFALTATDTDLGANARISYEIIEGNGEEKFGIFPDGYLFVRSPLDREDRDYYTLTVACRDGGIPSRSSVVPVIVHVLDENDNAPQFTNNTFTFSIAENEPSDSFVGKLTATDRDIGRNAELIYTLSAQERDFSIDTRNGFIRTKRPFDREALMDHRHLTDSSSSDDGINMDGDDSYLVLEATVHDNGVKRCYDMVKVKVIITDVNDNAPQFMRTPYRVQISEGASVGTHVIRVHASDLDKGLNGDVFYTLEEGNHGGQFALESATGQLSIARPLDREQKAVYRLLVIARDAAAVGHQLSSNTTITIELLDENDVAPQFAAIDSEVEVLETSPVGTELVRFHATDTDLGVNSQIAYSLTAGNRRDTFHINAFTGSLYLHKPLDYEDTTEYHLNVTASDSGSPRLATTMAFTVRVVDENDNAPIFPNTAIVRQIKEGIANNTPIVTVTAEDPDSGSNGMVSYAIIRQEPELIGGWHFRINAQTGVIYTLRDIDRETIDTFRLTVVATDQAQLPESQLSGEKLVTVIVEDINDNAPVFVSMNAALLPVNIAITGDSSSLIERSRNGLVVMYVEARDADSSSNGLVTYELVSDETGLFKLQRNNGVLTLNKSLKHTLQVYYRLSVKATDEAVQSERKSTDAYITIITPGSGHNGPDFIQYNQSVSVYENMPAGTIIATVKAELNGAEIEYYVTNVTAIGITGDGGNSIGMARIQVERLFDIDTKLGMLSTAQELDRDAGPDTYEVEVYAIALGGAARTSSTKVTVTVLDKNDSPPIFRDTPLVFNVSEDLNAGHLIATIRASDVDIIGDLNFTLIGGDVDGQFLIEPESGRLRLKQALDREKKDTYKLRLRVHDGEQYTETIVDIQVMDTNDNAPVFDDVVYSFDILENAARGYQVGVIAASDADLGQNAEVTYTVISDWANDVFSLNSQTGVFTLTAGLDYEEVQHYIIVVQAQDNGHPSLSSTISVYCNVIDLNDNAPIFNSMSYSNEVYENVTIGTMLIMVTATDIDSDDNGKIEYLITSGDDTNDLEINSNGTIRTRRQLDRETKSSYNLIVTARDCAPEYPTLYNTNKITTSTNQYKNVNSISSNNGLPAYRWRRQRHHRQRHYVEQQQLHLQQQQQRLSSTVQVTIILKDVNDEAPQFTTPNEIMVLENIALNTVVLTIKAVDRDEGRNGYVEYLLDYDSNGDTFSEQLPFTLGLIDGQLRVSGRLDREYRAMYLLNVTAHDRGEPRQQTHTQLTVRILDENDNSPVFDPKHYSTSVAENASIGAMVLQVSATDIDEDTNGRVRFSIVAGDENRDFSISEDSGMVRVAKNLNYESKSRYVLTVRAEDCAEDVTVAYNGPEDKQNKGIKSTTPLVNSVLPQLTNMRFDTAELTIIITDINDNPPTFLDSPYLAYVMENVMPPNNGYLLTVHAYDADAPPLNSQVSYFLKEGDADLFRINSSSGEISLHRVLDREMKAEYTLTLVAMDKGSPPLTGTGVVHLIVQDVNDHSPKFERETYYGSVLENSHVGTKVLHPMASDLDAGLNAKLRFTLLGEHMNRFWVNSDTGEISTSRMLDREELTEYKLTLVAQDSSVTDPRATAVNVSISVLDVNDNEPSFEAASFNIHVPKNIRAGEFVYGARAIDHDAGINAKIVYNISGKDADKFIVNIQTGVIKTRSVLFMPEQQQSVYNIIIHATDCGAEQHSAMANLTVVLRDTDLFPSFAYMANTQFMLLEDVPEGKVITNTSATSVKKGVIRYAIAGGDIGEAVRIDARTGIVSVGKDGLDYEYAHQYEIWIEAANSDDPSLRSVIPLTINVTDVNDNAPEMEQLIYNVKILEEEPPQQVIQVKALDRDSGENGELTYRLIDDFESSFEIDSDSGKIFTTRQLDREELATYNLVVEAIDQGLPQLTGTATVHIDILDKNDNPPKFTRLYAVNVTENAEIGSFVIQLTSTDLDEGINAVATYSFTVNSGENFKIDPVSGNITVAGQLDREQQDEYLLKAAVSDGAWRQETPITITIQDQNDNAPEFEHSFYSFNFPELQRAVAFVGQVIATDRDKQGPNSIISYSMQQVSDLFIVDPATGEIFSKRTIKYMHSQYKSSPENIYIITVLATDNGKPPMYSECQVNINIVDANNNPPHFEQQEYLAPVPQHAKIGQQIIRLHAVDNMDYGVNAEIDYVLVAGNASDHFMINKQDGWISLVKPLNKPPNTVYTMTVKATDRGVPPQSDNAHVTIIVTGENVYTPEFTALSYQVIVPENEPVESTILTVSATDRDIGPNGILRYSISDGNESKNFGINALTGAIIILQPLDYELLQEYHLNITVHDLAYKSKYAIALLTIILTDINDNPPLFNQTEYHAFIAENIAPPAYVFQAHATDKDSPKNAVIHYAITDTSDHKLFKINASSGEILSNIIFDYENRNEYTLQLIASNPDSPMQSTAVLYVHITGINEYYPQFVQPVFRFDVSESSAVGTTVGAVQAKDKDAGEDGRIYYLLVGNDKGFIINTQTGIVRVSRHLDRETQSRVVLTVLAKNFGSIRGNDTDEAQIIITIQDGNDPPRFLKELYNTSISEAAPIGTKMTIVKAVDTDVRPQNNEFSYSIINGNVHHTFKVDPRTGEIETTRVLDRETIASYELIVGAIDMGLPPQTGTTTVHVEVNDVNDNAPTFKPDGLLGFISENEPEGTLIMTLTAIDADLPPNGGPFTYQLIGGKHKMLLSLDKHSGVLKSTRSYDREQTPELEALIEVEDNGTPPQKARHKLRVQVLDQNDCPSLPRNCHVLLNIYEQEVPHGMVADVHPNDADIIGNYTCRIVPTSQSSPLGIFIIPRGCELHTTSATQPGGYAYAVSGNDGRHEDVISTFTIAFQAFDKDTVAHTLPLLVKSLTAEQFLALHYHNFVELVKSTYLESGDKLLLYSIRNTVLMANSTDLELLLSVRMANGMYRTTQQLFESFSKKREALETLLQTPERLLIGYSPCDLPDACANSGLCTAKLRVANVENTPLNIVDSQSLVFSSPLVSFVHSCKCQEGYIGAYCDQNQFPCDPNPCQGNAQCRQHGRDYQCICPPQYEGKHCDQKRGDVCASSPCRNGGSCQHSPDGSNFFCLCRPGYRGNQCEHVADSCRPNPCLHGGLCIALKPGYKCNCPDGHYGMHCERTSFGFKELSYMSFPALHPATNDISIVFATTKPDALLLYNYGAQTSGRSDFLAIEVVRGKAFFSFGGARTSITSVVVGSKNEGAGLADGNWYKITATRNGRMMSLSVVKCFENGDVCEDCRPGDINCYADDVAPIGILNFNKEPLLLGGIASADPILERPGQIHTDDFIGCMHSVYINGRALNLSNPLSQRDVLLTCNRSGGATASAGPCHQGLAQEPIKSLCGIFGRCMDRWHTAMCECGNSLLAPDCFGSLEPITLFGGAFVEFKISEKHRRMQLLDQLYRGNTVWSYDDLRHRRDKSDTLTPLPQISGESPKMLSLLFRTYKEDGLLLYAATNQHYTVLELRNGWLAYSSKQQGATLVNMTIIQTSKAKVPHGPSTEVSQLNDGKWHNVTLHAASRTLRLLIDGRRIGEELDLAGVHDFLDPYLTVLSVGGVRRELLSPEHVGSPPVWYVGCMANFTINNEIQPFNGSGSVFSSVVSHGQQASGCSDDIGIGAAQMADPLSIGITLVIVFFVILAVAILGSYVIYRFRGQQEKIGGLSCGVPGFKIQHNTGLLGGGGSGAGVSGVGSQSQADHVLTRSAHPVDGQIIGGYQGDCGGDLIRGVTGHHLVGPELIAKKYKDREIGSSEHQQRPQRPDIIEREVVGKSPPLRDDRDLPPLPPPTQVHHPHEHASNSVDLSSDYPEHYDLENASSIAPSDIDIVYHYKGYREAGGLHKYKVTPAPVAAYTHHAAVATAAAQQQQHRHSPRHGVGAPFVPRGVPQTSQAPSSNTPRPHQSTPLARLSPSSELSSQQPRILTLHDISGKPLQSALLATTSSSGGVGKNALHSNSERSLNSPVMSQLSGQSSSASRQKPGGPPPAPTQASLGGLTAEEIERLNVRPRTSSLVSTLDAVSSSSEAPRGSTGAHHLVALGGGLHSTVDVDAHSSTSTDESGNDSFTCSEIEYDNNSLSGDTKFPTATSKNGSGIGVGVSIEHGGVGRVSRSVGSAPSLGGAGSMGKTPQMLPHSYDGFDSSFRGSLSTLVASDDDFSTHMGGGGLYHPGASASPATSTLSWDYLLNWGPNFESLMGVFKDIAKLPNTVHHEPPPHAHQPPLRLPPTGVGVQQPPEEYV